MHLRGFVHGELGKRICCSWDAAKTGAEGLHILSFVAAAAQCLPTTLKGMVWTGCYRWEFGSCLHFFVPRFLLSRGSNGYSLQGIKKKAFRILSGVFSSCVRTKGMDNPSPCRGLTLFNIEMTTTRASRTRCEKKTYHFIGHRAIKKSEWGK